MIQGSIYAQDSSILVIWPSRIVMYVDVTNNKALTVKPIFLAWQQDELETIGILQKLSTLVPKKNRCAAKLHGKPSSLVTTIRVLTSTLFETNNSSFLLFKTT